MIDFHNHILPLVDDGSKSLEMSINMLREAENQGIKEIVNTVHYQHPQMLDKNTSYDYILKVKENLLDKIEQEKINIKIHLGAEVYFDFNLIDLIDNKLVTFLNGKYMLVEFQASFFPNGFEKHLYELKLSGVTPIIAHPERYRPVQEDIDIIGKLIDSGCLIQIDAGSLLGHFGKKCYKTSREMLIRNMVHIIGSDSHNDKNRNFCLSSASQKAKKIVGVKVEDYIYKNPLNIIKGEEIDIPEVVYQNLTSSLFSRIFRQNK